MDVIKPALILLLFIHFNEVTAQNAKEVVANYIEFIGGEKQLKSIKSIQTFGTYNYGGKLFPFTTYAKSPDFYKVVVSLNEKKFIQAFDGKRGWKIDGFNNETKPTIYAGSDARAMMNEEEVEFENPFINYLKKGSRLFFEGKDTVDSRLCFKIKFISKRNEAITYFFSCENAELVMKTAVSKNSEMNNVVINQYYSDYRTVKGLKWPFKIITKLKDQLILDVTIEKIELNSAISDKEFKL